jgi:hypothetical protein
MAHTCQIWSFQNASGLKSRHEFASLFYSPTSDLTPALAVSRVTPCHSRKYARIGGMLKFVQALSLRVSRLAGKTATCTKLEASNVYRR